MKNSRQSALVTAGHSQRLLKVSPNRSRYSEMNSPMCQKPLTSATALIASVGRPAQAVVAHSIAAASACNDACSCREWQPRRYAASAPIRPNAVPFPRCTTSCRRWPQGIRRTFGPATDSWSDSNRLPPTSGAAACTARSTACNIDSSRLSIMWGRETTSGEFEASSRTWRVVAFRASNLAGTLATNRANRTRPANHGPRPVEVTNAIRIARSFTISQAVLPLTSRMAGVCPSTPLRITEAKYVPSQNRRSSRWWNIRPAEFSEMSAADRSNTISASRRQTPKQNPCSRAECCLLRPAARCSGNDRNPATD